ncbi:MAG: pilus assembly protein TadG-related protein [Desulfobacca sp.]|nr:pilus assembly protein TadG-related protein [Desulfobacca sp.]
MKRLRRFITDDRGSVAVMTAISLLAILVIAALAVDYGHWQDTIVKMQTAADAGATAGAARLLTVKEGDQGYQVEVNGISGTWSERSPPKIPYP